jgi:hypothetical protein
MKKAHLIILLFQMISLIGFSQTNEAKKGMYIMKAQVIDGDTVLVAEIPELNVFPGYIYKNRWDYMRYERLVRNVKAAYPYAKLAGAKLKELDRQLVEIKSERKRKELIDSTEKKLREDFEEDVKRLTITQGRILIKLIDRETGSTSYHVLQNVKGNVSAVFWQAIARLFGSSLKSEYDPYGEDALIEMIILMIDAGQL